MSNMHDFKCPKCGHDEGSFYTVCAVSYDSQFNLDLGEEPEPQSDDPCACAECGYWGKVSDFGGAQ